MSTLKLMLLISTIMLSACGPQNRIKPGNAEAALAENEGLMGLVINSLDPLTNIQLRDMQTNREFYIGGAKKGVTILLTQLIEGQYCLVGFDVYNFRVDYENQGFCTYVEPGEMNYFSEFVVRDPLTSAVSNYNRFVKLLGQQYPKICKEYIGTGCS